MKHTSVWNDSREESAYPSLAADISVDVAIIGGGIAGITAALLLDIDGKTVAVYRSRAGACTTLSPVCPHLAGYIKWNNAESTRSRQGRGPSNLSAPGLPPFRERNAHPSPRISGN